MVQERIGNYLSLIKFSHTIFALPFALVGFTLGTLATGHFEWHILLLVILCMVFARSAAMAFNRYLDRDIDRENPRTAVREIPAGIISATAALRFVILNSLLFIATTWFINSLCFFLSPVALLVILGYSYTKRFTAWCHFVLGLGLALAPVGAYLAVTGAFAWLPVLYGLVVLCWVAGFDIIYALQDVEFDQSHALSSMPVRLGRAGALRLSNAIHLLSGIILLGASYWQWEAFAVFSWLQWLAAAIFLALLIYQHTIVRADDLSRVNLAFFTTNGLASLVFGLLVITDAFLL
jgi:4-hydroxybenzoate polyprenyltransferase